MQRDRVRPGFGRTAAGTVLVGLSLAGAVCGLTLLFLGMRGVMAVGGACADGGPYVSAQPCPDGVPLAILGGLWGGLILFGVYVWACAKYGVSGLWLLAWPALFLSLGWNFLEYGVNPPGGDGMAWGWLVCAVVFGLMGGVPLLLVAPHLLRTLLPIGGEPRERQVDARRANALADLVTVASPLGRSAASGGVGAASTAAQARTTADPRPTGDACMVDALERLANLRSQGALTEAEFAEAKRRLLGDEP